MKKRIIFDAEPFCYGPVSTTLNLVQYLRSATDLPQRFDFTLVSTGTSLELARASGGFDELMDASTADPRELARLRPVIDEAALYISNTNPAAIVNLRDSACKKLYIDLLFWMWDKLEFPVDEVDSFCVQDFYRTQAQLDRLGISPERVTRVGPIIPHGQSPAPAEDDLVLVSFGGIDSLYVDTPVFHDTLLGALLELPTLQGKRVVVAGGGSTIAALAKRHARPDVRIGTLSRAEFGDTLARCGRLICNAGIITFYEALALGKPMFFLPPHNYSQHLQFSLIQETYPSIAGLRYDELLPGLPQIPPYLEEREGIHRVHAAMEAFVEDPQVLERVVQQVGRFLDAPAQPCEAAGLQSGVRQVAAEIARLV